MTGSFKHTFYYNRLEFRPRRVALWFLFLLVMLGGMPATVQAGVERGYVRFVTRTNETIYGIVVRLYPKKLIVATTGGIKQLRHRDLMVRGRALPEVRAISDLMGIIEANLADRDFDRVQKNLLPLKQAMEQFNQFAAPIFKSVIASDRPIQLAVKNAQTYYSGFFASIKPTIERLKMAQEATQIDHGIIERRLTYDHALLQRLVELERRAAAITVSTPLAERETAKMEELLAKHLQRCSTQARERALERLKHRSPSSVVRLTRVLCDGAVFRKNYITELDRLFVELPPILAKDRVQLRQCLDALIPEKINVEAVQKKYTAADAVVRAEMNMLNELVPLVRASHAVKSLAILKREQKAGMAFLQEIGERKTAIFSMRQFFSEAELALARNAYDQAIQAFQKAANLIHVKNLPAPGRLKRASDGIFQAQALQLKSVLEQADAIDFESLNGLIAQGERLLAGSRARLTRVGLNPGILKKDIERVRNQQHFILSEKKIMAMRETSPVEAWYAYMELEKWVKGVWENLFPSAQQEWKKFSAVEQMPLFTAGAAAFFDNPARCKKAWQRPVLYSFIQRPLAAGDLKQAEKMLFDGLDATPRGSTLQRQLGLMSRSIAEALVKKGKPSAAAQLYTDLQLRFPKLAKEIKVDDFLAALDVRRADRLVITGGDLTEAIKIYRDVCDRHEDFARRKGIFEKIIDLRVRTADALFLNDHVAAMKIYEEICREYPGWAKKNISIQQRKKDFLATVKAAWENRRFRQAVDLYRDFAAKYPAFSRETGLLRSVVAVIRKAAIRAHGKTRHEHRLVPKSMLEVLNFVVAKYPRESMAENLDEELVDLQLERADQFVSNGEISRAFEIYQEVLVNQPKLAKARRVRQKIEDITLRFRLARIRKPLGLQTGRDLVLFLFTLFFWPLLFSQTFYTGRQQGHLRYRLLHAGIIFGIFLFIAFLLLFVHRPYTDVFVWAFLLPQFVFHVVGMFSYSFFPLIYFSRRAVLEEGLFFLLHYRLFGQTLAELGLARAGEWLEGDIAKVRADLPLLYDRWLFRLEKAAELAAVRPQRALSLFEGYMRQLERELIKNEQWRQRYGTCLFRAGQTALILGERDRGIKHLEDSLKLDPRHVQSHLLLADVRFMAGEYRQAIPHLKVALAADGGNDRLWYRLGRAFFETGKPAAAYKCFESVRNADRDTCFYQARAYARSGQFRKAINAYQALLHEYPNDGAAIYYLSSTLAGHNLYDKAMKSCSILPPDDPFYSRALALQGTIFIQQNEPKNAQARFREAIKQDPHCVPAYLGLAQIELENNKPQNALKLVEMVFSDAADDPSAHYYAGIAYEQSDVGKALFHFNKALVHPEFKRMIERRMGRLYFFRDEYIKARQHFAAAEAEGEDAPWYLYLYAYTLAALGESSACRRILDRLFEIPRGLENEDWWNDAPRALYALGVKLLEGRDHETAIHCFEFVFSLVPETERPYLEQVIEEVRFRMLITMMREGRYDEFTTALVAIERETKNADRLRSCRYYRALAQLTTRQYASARSGLGALLKENPGDPRYLYHGLIAALGEGDEPAATRNMVALSEAAHLPGHIQAGLETVKAYLKARKGLIRDAYEILETLSSQLGDMPGREVILSRIMEMRVLFLCHMKDQERLKSIVAEMPNSARAGAVYLQAVSAVENGMLETARQLLLPLAGEEGRHRRLFLGVCTHLALTHVQQQEYTAAQEILDAIPSPPLAIESIRNELLLSETIKTAEKTAGLQSAIATLEQELERAESLEIRHSLVHNLAVLYLKRCVAEEEQNQMEPLDLENLWSECIDFWYREVFDNPDYWNQEQLRLVDVGTKTEPFSPAVIGQINASVLSSIFLQPFANMAFYCFKEGNVEKLERVLRLLFRAAEPANKVRTVFGAFSKRISQFTRDLDRDDVFRKSWNYRLASLVVQLAVQSAMGDSTEELVEELATLRLCRDRYSSPDDYQREVRRFNAALMEIMRLGGMGSFAQAGSKLEKLFRQIPPGALSGKMEDHLRLLRENCRKPADAANRGIDLKGEFDQCYQALKKIQISDSKHGR